MLTSDTQSASIVISRSVAAMAPPYRFDWADSRNSPSRSFEIDGTDLRVAREHNERRIIHMPKIVKVIELMSESSKSWEEAVQNVVTEASKTLRNIRSVYVKEFTAAVENDKVTSYRINAKVTFEMER
jgi:flavin-binding protein dodecin